MDSVKSKMLWAVSLVIACAIAIISDRIPLLLDDFTVIDQDGIAYKRYIVGWPIDYDAGTKLHSLFGIMCNTIVLSLALVMLCIVAHFFIRHLRAKWGQALKCNI
jgi:hypothetical protein